MNINFWSVIISSLLFSCPLLIAATGGILSTRAGIANFSFDGIICAGAAIYCIIIAGLKNNLGPAVILLALLGSILTGFIFSLIFSFATVTLKANQILVSMALNYIGYGIALSIPFLFTGNEYFSISAIYIKVYPWAYIVTTLFLVFLFATFLFLTKYGLYIRAVGENQNAAALNYINVGKMQYLISSFSCALASFAGGFLVYVKPSLFTTNNNFSGLGFLIIAILIMARKRFILTAIFCILFSFLLELSNNLKALSNLTNNTPTWLYGIIPYVSTLLLLIIFRYKTDLPANWGKSYNKNSVFR